MEDQSKVKVFLSFPIKVKSNEQIWYEIEMLKAYYLSIYPENADRVKFVHIFEPNMERGYADQNSRVRIRKLGEALQKIAECDQVVFHPDWRSSRGCRVAYSACKEFGIIVTGDYNSR